MKANKKMVRDFCESHQRASIPCIAKLQWGCVISLEDQKKGADRYFMCPICFQEMVRSCNRGNL